jgi:serine protease Do
MRTKWVGLIVGAFALFHPRFVNSAAAPTDIRRDAVVDAVERAMPSVVNIATKTKVQRRGYVFDWFRQNWAPFSEELPPQYAAGSGVIIDEAGYVLTNVHVVEGADEIWVKLWDDRPPVRAAREVIGSRRSDVALLKLMGKPGEKFTAIRFAADNDLLLGETVIALGNPFGLGGSVSRGILSSKNRRTSTETDQLEVADWLQTDAAINPGNSGGPLINLQGEMIGINVAVSKEGQGIGFAIPIKEVSQALSVLFTPEVSHSLWFGARIKLGSSPLSIGFVQPGSPAETAGLREGDKVIEINGKRPKTLVEANDILMADQAKTAKLTVQRDGANRTIEVRFQPLVDLIRQKTGASVQELTPELAKAMGLNANSGLLIGGVDKGGPAAQAELREGYVIAAIDRQSTPDILSAASALWSKKKGDLAELTVVTRWQRGGFVRYDQGSARLKLR